MERYAGIPKEEIEYAPAEPLSVSNFDGRFVVPGCDEVVWDAQIGAGSTGNVKNIRYMGFMVLMKPSDFLKLAVDLPEELTSRVSFNHLADRVKTEGWAPLFLTVNLDRQSVKNHEGRHRAKSFMKLCGDIPVPVYIFPYGGDDEWGGKYREIRARHVKDEEIRKLNTGMHSEKDQDRNNQYRVGPFFDKAFLQDREINF